MLSVLIEGLLTADPVSRVATNGNPYTTAKVRTAGADGASILCNLIAFDTDVVQALTALVAGDSLAVVGHAAISLWAGKDGQPRAGLQITASRVTSIYAASRQRKATTQMERQP